MNITSAAASFTSETPSTLTQARSNQAVPAQGNSETTIGRRNADTAAN
jgi:hypothetical protein